MLVVCLFAVKCWVGGKNWGMQGGVGFGIRVRVLVGRLGVFLMDDVPCCGIQYHKGKFGASTWGGESRCVNCERNGSEAGWDGVEGNFGYDDARRLDSWRVG